MKKLFFKISIAFIFFMAILFLANFVYTKYFYRAELKKLNAETILDLDSLQYACDALYFGESSNSSTSRNDTIKLSISAMIDEQVPFIIGTVEHEAVDAHTYIELIKNIQANAKVKTILVTLNMRSFGAPWIYSFMNNALLQQRVMYEPIPNIIKRMKLVYQLFDKKEISFRDSLREYHWQHDKINVPDSFKYKNVRQWDDGMANGTFRLANGELWDIPKISLACHYIKTYAFSIDTLTNPRIKDFDEIVNIAKRKNLNLIFNLLSENVQYADSLVGKELVALMRENKNLLIDRYNKNGVIVVDNFELVNGKDFTDQDWTTEHYNQRGRKSVAENVVLKASNLLK